MEKIIIFITFMFSILFIFSIESSKDGFPVFKGPYLGQIAPVDKTDIIRKVRQKK